MNIVLCAFEVCVSSQDWDPPESQMCSTVTNRFGIIYVLGEHKHTMRIVQISRNWKTHLFLTHPFVKCMSMVGHNLEQCYLVSVQDVCRDLC
jgi:hypothetical protein